MRVYLDNGATTKVAPEVVQKMQPYLEEQYGNPESLHKWGRDAREAIDQAREQIAQKLGCQSEEVIFTGSGSEANNLALNNVKHHLIISQIEHSSILEKAKQLESQGIKVTYLPVNKEGIVKIEALENALDEGSFVSIMHANNETGVIQPVKKIYELCKEKGAIFHTDAIQSFGKLETPQADMISINAHKIHGPKGIGALMVKEGIKIKPMIYGGPQEFSKRASTHNVAGIIGFGQACNLITPEDIERMKTLRDKLIKESSAVLNGSENRLCNNANLAFKGREAESILLNLDEQGIACSMGSACHAAKLEPSYVLKAMNTAPDLLLGSLRFVISKYTTEEEINYTLEKLKEL
jgi:cysteine desulfurase